jgi:Inner membrane protein CreD
MTVRRLGAIALIFLGSTFAWSVLGSSLVARSGELDGRLSQEVARLWGGAHRQLAPEAAVQRPVEDTEIVDAKAPDGRVVRSEVRKTVLRPIPAALTSTRASADLGLQYRHKGLLWFSTYDVAFSGRYQFVNPDAETRAMHVRFPLPAADVMYDDFEFHADGRPLTLASDISKEAVGVVQAAPNATVVVEVRYRSRGMGTWSYGFVPSGTAQVRDFALTVTTNVRDIDFPPGTMSPTSREARGDGTVSTWAFTNLLTGQSVGVALPERLNPGPFAARVTFFAPVSLLFFLAVMVMLGVTTGRSLHPMHYWFLAAAFFAFHLLLAYLVDLVPVHAAFATAAAVSVFLVVSYLRVVTGMRRALLEAGAAQVVFLVLFSYAFFFRGLTGLTITIGAVVTLFVLMQMTARIAWDEVFQRGPVGAPFDDGGRDVARR